MELKIKKIFFKSYILNTENQTEFIVNHKVIFDYLFKSSYMPV